MIIKAQFLAPPKITDVEVEPSDDIAAVKLKIEAVDGRPADKMRIFFAGKQTEDGRMLSDYNVQAGSTVHVMVRF